ncbi:MAG: hypothetical protein OEQ39_28920 [Gammaproteobacteria bacterium]|nr:hypothetical protein [Gammaproteobacteria bacterium]
MGRYSKDSGGSDFTPAPVGNHIARCIKLTDLGTQHGEYMGELVIRSQILVTWELPTELMEDKKPFTVSKFYTNSLHEKSNLRKDLTNWRSREFTEEELKNFDLENILGKACMLNVIHNDKGQARIIGVASLPKAVICPPQVNPSLTFWLDEFEQSKFDALSDGIKKIIQQSDEWKFKHRKDHAIAPMNEQYVKDAGAVAAVARMDDDIPF